MVQPIGSAVDRWNLFKDSAPIKEDVINVEFEVSGELARMLMNEASRRNISYSDMAKVLFEQGLYFWSPKQ
jgi:hypothetical protein